LTIRRDEVEARVLTALKEKLLRQDLFEEFCDEFTREMNRLRMEHRASLSAARREIERVELRRKKLIEMVMDGVAPSEVRDEINANAAKREELKAKLAAADMPPPLLHPEMAELYRQKVTALAQALDRPDARTEASEPIRGLIDAIILVPAGDELRIELKGNLAAMLSAAQNAKRSPSGDLLLQVAMVAGAGFEPCIPCFSNLLMARDFWSKRVMLKQLDGGIQFSPLLRRTLESTAVLETIWRRRGPLRAHVSTDRQRSQSDTSDRISAPFTNSRCCARQSPRRSGTCFRGVERVRAPPSAATYIRSASRRHCGGRFLSPCATKNADQRIVRLVATILEHLVR